MTGIRWSREVIPQKTRGAIWIMVGRPRKSGRRQPNGQLARSYINPKAQVACQPHRLNVLSKYREWPEAESEFGRLMLNDRITPAQYQAGRLYAGLADSYRASWDMPRLHPAGIDLTRVGVSQGPEMASDQTHAIRVRYQRAFEVCMEAGHRAERAVKDHAVLERKISDFGTLDLLRSGLDKLVKHFGIDPELQISESRN